MADFHTHNKYCIKHFPDFSLFNFTVYYTDLVNIANMSITGILIMVYEFY